MTTDKFNNISENSENNQISKNSGTNELTGKTKQNVETILIPKEIEKKFLIKELPENLQDYPHKEIIQGYIAITEDGTEVRLRKKGNKFFQTVKSSGDKIRNEFESELTKEQFEIFWESTAGKRIEKVRYEIPYEYENQENGESKKIKVNIELDIYKGKLSGLYSAEVEFKTEEDSNKFITPEWFGEDVTNDKRYKNKNLALKGKPEKE